MDKTIKLLKFKQLGDERGHLVAIEGNSREIPFDIKRIFYIYGTSSDTIRGQHANRKTEFVLINVSGSSKVMVKNAKGKETIYSLDAHHKGIYLPAMTWKEMYDFSEDSVLLCLASEHYDAEEYIRDYDEYVKQINGER